MRLLANTFWVWTTDRAFSSLRDLFHGAVTAPTAIVLQVAGLSSALLLSSCRGRAGCAISRRAAAAVLPTRPAASLSAFLSASICESVDKTSSKDLPVQPRAELVEPLLQPPLLYR